MALPGHSSPWGQQLEPEQVDSHWSTQVTGGRCRPVRCGKTKLHRTQTRTGQWLDGVVTPELRRDLESQPSDEAGEVGTQVPRPGSAQGARLSGEQQAGGGRWEDR